MADSIDSDLPASADVADFYDRIREEIGSVVIGNEDVIRGITASILTRGHVLLEGVPGVAKTTMANAFSRAIGLEYNRIQMTPDILPADITGTTIYRESLEEFTLQRGPIFTNVVVADEINRATPKTQSALLEAMQENAVTIGDSTLDLPDPFIVIATQNPIEMEGVFELPEAQRDRFQQKHIVRIPERTAEEQLLDQFDTNPELDTEVIQQVVTLAELQEAQQAVDSVHVSESVKSYILDIVEATRASSELEYGGSPRASLAFLSVGKSYAAMNGREYVIPDDIKRIVKPILRHRVVRSTDAQLSDRSADEILDEVVNGIATPGSQQSTASE